MAVFWQPEPMFPEWDAWQVLSMGNPERDGRLTCVGNTKQHIRCKNPIKASNRGLADAYLRRIPAAVAANNEEQLRYLLSELANVSLCVSQHRDQNAAMVAKWMHVLQRTVPGMAMTRVDTQVTTLQRRDSFLSLHDVHVETESTISLPPRQDLRDELREHLEGIMREFSERIQQAELRRQEELLRERGTAVSQREALAQEQLEANRLQAAALAAREAALENSARTAEAAETALRQREESVQNQAASLRQTLEEVHAVQAETRLLAAKVEEQQETLRLREETLALHEKQAAIEAEAKVQATKAKRARRSCMGWVESALWSCDAALWVRKREVKQEETTAPTVQTAQPAETTTTS